jgi:hypothetical protein
MVRLVFNLSKRDDVSLEDFRKVWQEEYIPLVERAASLYATSKHQAKLTLAVQANLMFTERRGYGRPHDAVVEMWWDSAGSLPGKAETPEAEELRQAFDACEEKFVDASRSCAYFTEA